MMISEKLDVESLTCEHFAANYDDAKAVCLRSKDSGYCVKEKCVVKETGSISLELYFGYENWR